MICKYKTAIVYLICIYCLNILHADVSEKTQEYDSKSWEPATDELETQSNALRGDVCDMLDNIKSPCNETEMPITTEPPEDSEQPPPKVKKNFRIRLFFSLLRLNSAFVGCLKEAVKDVAVMFLKSVLSGVACVFQPVTNAVKLVLHIILDSVTLIGNVHAQTKLCLSKNWFMKHVCLSTMTARTTTRFVKNLMAIVNAITKLVLFLSTVGLQSRMAMCAVTGVVQGIVKMTMVGVQLGKCVLCVYKGNCN